jgi:hypothetical protein
MVHLQYFQQLHQQEAVEVEQVVLHQEVMEHQEDQAEEEMGVIILHQEDQVTHLQ